MATDITDEGRCGDAMQVVELSRWQLFEDSQTYECRVLLVPEEDGGFSAHALRLPGVSSQGDTVEEALENIAEAFRGVILTYLEELGRVPWEEASHIERTEGSMERWILVDVQAAQG